jgi:hypothetical protein
MVVIVHTINLEHLFKQHGHEVAISRKKNGMG